MGDRVEALLNELTLEEKGALTSGVDMWHGTGVERLGVRGLKVSDGPNGARGAYFAGTTSACVPCGTALGATWDTDLIERVGRLLGDETKSKGADLLLAPTVNIHRTPLAGRNFECYSEDPYLTARLAVAYITGVQATGVATAVKHLVANDSEFERHTISSEVDERTLREIYLVPFEAAITEARSWSVMAAYNRLGGTYCSEHEFLMRLVHDEWDLPGFVISDWWSIKSTIETGRHGCDLEMPGPTTFLGEHLSQAVRDGDLPEDALDAKVRRLLTTMEALGVLDRPEHAADTSVDLPEHRALLRETARAAIVMLQNRDATLPLEPGTLTKLAVIGPNADVAVVQGGGSAAVNPHHTVTVLDGLRARLGDAVEVVHERAVDSFRNAPPLDPRWTRPTNPAHPDHGFTVEYFAGRELEGEPTHVTHSDSARFTWLGDPWDGVVGGDFSMAVTATLVAPEDGDFTLSLITGGRGRVYVDGDLVLDMWDEWRPGTAFFGLGSEEIRTSLSLHAGDERQIRAEFSCVEGLPAAAFLVGGLAPTPSDGIERAAAAARDADAAVIVVGLNQDWETEGEDRASTRLPGGQIELIEAVAAANPRTIVLVNAGSPVDMAWADEVGAICQLWYLGQEAGDAVADVLVGDHSPGGRLPTTFAVREADHPSLLNYPGEFGEVRYGEGLFVGYRAFDRLDIEPRFCFGHGLSYTSFEYSAPTVDTTEITDGGAITLRVTVTNTGDRAGAEVVQVYVSDVEATVVRPLQELKGFAKVHLDPGESSEVAITLDERAFSFWNPAEQGWMCQAGDFELHVGSSSRDRRGTVRVTRPA